MWKGRGLWGIPVATCGCGRVDVRVDVSWGSWEMLSAYVEWFCVCLFLGGFGGFVFFFLSVMLKRMSQCFFVLGAEDFS